MRVSVRCGTADRRTVVPASAPILHSDGDSAFHDNPPRKSLLRDPLKVATLVVEKAA